MAYRFQTVAQILAISPREYLQNWWAESINTVKIGLTEAVDYLAIYLMLGGCFAYMLGIKKGGGLLGWF